MGAGLVFLWWGVWGHVRFFGFGTVGVSSDFWGGELAGLFAFFGVATVGLSSYF